MIHGDNQYNPKYSSIMIEKLIKDKDLSASVGSRMKKKMSAIKGKMPFYKFIGKLSQINIAFPSGDHSTTIAKISTPFS